MPAKAVMSDKEYLQDILTTEKSLANLYNVATQESRTPMLRTQFKTSLNEALDMQSDVFNQMSGNGWYPTTNVPQTQIDQARNKFSA